MGRRDVSGDDKELYIEEIFSSIAPRYDLLNSILSLNSHKRWRTFAVRQCGLSGGDKAIDVAAGTLDLAIESAGSVGPSGRVLAIDFCRPMLKIGQEKLKKQGIDNVDVVEANAEYLPVRSSSFKAAIIGFALRNVASVENVLKEMERVVEPGGRVVSLELFQPSGLILKYLYRIYSKGILPIIGGSINRNKEAYEYLPKSVACFYSREELSRIIEKVGLVDVKFYNLTGGIATVHVGTKKW